MNESVEATLVLKFGGAAVATPQQFSRIAEIIADRRARYRRVVGIVSAMLHLTTVLGCQRPTHRAFLPE